MDAQIILKNYDAALARKDVRGAGEYLERMAEEAAREGDAAAEASLRGELIGYWRVRGDAEKSFSSARRAIELLEKLGMEESAAGATALLNYATSKTAFRATDEALELYRRVAAIYEKTIAPDDFRFASLYNNMAQALMRCGRTGEAFGFFKRSLDILSPGADDIEIATCCTNMAFCMLAAKNSAEAERCLARAEKIYAAFPDDPHAASALSCRGQLEYTRGEYNLAAEYFRKSAETVERVFGRTANYAAACRSCAKSLEAAGRADEAARYRALAEPASGSRGTFR